jgi:hypothetical protein
LGGGCDTAQPPNRNRIEENAPLNFTPSPPANEVGSSERPSDFDPAGRFVGVALLDQMKSSLSCEDPQG